jgi:ribonuclease HI
MTDRRVKLVLDGQVGDPNVVDTGVPQGSPAAPILFITYLSGIFDEVEKAAPGVSGLSFVDDIGWWAEGKNAEEVADKLSLAAAAAIEWAGRNGVAFDHGKTEAAIFWRKKRKGAKTRVKVKVGDEEIPFNKEATRWLGVWLDSQLTLREHHATRLKSGRNAMNRLRRLTGQMGLSPVNCRRIMTACVQSVAMFGAELWWKGGNVRGTTGRAEELQLLVNQQARAITGAFRTTNLGALSMESGLRPAANQLENRQRRFALRLLSLPQGEKARNVVGSSSEIGRRLGRALDYTWTQTEETVLLDDPEPFNADLIQDEREEAKREAERERPGLVMFTDGSRLESGAAGYAVAWKTGQTWKGIKTHMGYNQEAFDVECAALARALESAWRRNTITERITIFTDAQAAIRRMASDEPGPGQKYALEARKYIAALRRKVPGIVIEVRWCPAHEGVEGNEKADEWAKLAAEEPDARGVEGLEWMTYSDRPEERSMPLPRSIANIKREIAEKKWAEARKWAGGRISKEKYKMPKSQRPDGTVAGSAKRLASRFYQLKTGHCLTGEYLCWTKSRPTPQCWWCRCPRQTRHHLLKRCPRWKKEQRILWEEVYKETGRGRERWKAHELFAESECSQSVLDFLSSTDVGKIVPAVEEDGAGSEVSEWELRERREREEEREAEAEALGAEDEGDAGEELRLFLPTPLFMASAEEN